MAKSVPAIFLDRDGTINVDHGYVHEIDNFEFIDGVIDAMRELKKMGFALVVVTNQSGIARGKFTEAQFETLTEWMDWSLADRDVDLDGIYYCPHHPQGSVEEFRQVCDCRKPHPGMLLSARDYLHIDMGVYGKENRVYYWERELLLLNSFNDELFCHCVTSRNCSIRC